MKKLSEGIDLNNSQLSGVFKCGRVVNPAGLLCVVCRKDFSVGEIIYYKEVAVGKELGFEHYHSTCKITGRPPHDPPK